MFVENVAFRLKKAVVKYIVLVFPVLQKLRKNHGIVIFSSRIFSAVVCFDLSFLTPRGVNE